MSEYRAVGAQQIFAEERASAFDVASSQRVQLGRGTPAVTVQHSCLRRVYDAETMLQCAIDEVDILAHYASAAAEGGIDPANPIDDAAPDSQIGADDQAI